MTNIQFATVTSVDNDKIKVKFNMDDTASELEYLKLKSYTPTVGDRVIMVKTGATYICLGAIG